MAKPSTEQRNVVPPPRKSPKDRNQKGWEIEDRVGKKVVPKRKFWSKIMDHPPPSLMSQMAIGGKGINVSDMETGSTSSRTSVGPRGQYGLSGTSPTGDGRNACAGL